MLVLSDFCFCVIFFCIYLRQNLLVFPNLLIVRCRLDVLSLCCEWNCLPLIISMHCELSRWIFCWMSVRFLVLSSLSVAIWRNRSSEFVSAERTQLLWSIFNCVIPLSQRSLCSFMCQLKKQSQFAFEPCWQWFFHEFAAEIFESLDNEWAEADGADVREIDDLRAFFIREYVGMIFWSRSAILNELPLGFVLFLIWHIMFDGENSIFRTWRIFSKNYLQFFELWRKFGINVKFDKKIVANVSELLIFVRCWCLVETCAHFFFSIVDLFVLSWTLLFNEISPNWEEMKQRYFLLAAKNPK